MFKTHRSGPLAAALALLTWAGGVQAQFVLNDTGVTVCGVATGNGAPGATFPCAGSGQDGEYGRDVASPGNGDGALGFKFTALCNGGDRAGRGACPARPVVGVLPGEWRCTFDQVTGLLWEIKVPGGGAFGPDTRFTSLKPGQPGYGGSGDASGLALQANALALCNRTDWRVPEAREVQSLVHYGLPAGPVIDAAWFPNTVAAEYWTATDGNAAASRQTDPNNVWGIDMASGMLWHNRRLVKNRVRLVAGVPRTAGSIVAGRFKVSADGSEVLDRSTRLIWRHCSEGQLMDHACTGTPTLVARQDVLAYTLPPGWRLPNIKELSGLIDTGQSYPALDPAVFPNSYEEGSYWSSSLLTGTGYLWFVGIGTGAVIYTRHPTGAIRLVREATLR